MSSMSSKLGRLFACVLIAAFVTVEIRAQTADRTIKIGVLTDLNSLFANASGSGSVTAAQMAVEDFRASYKGIDAQVISADHQNKADIGSAIVRKWLEIDHVDAIVDVPNSSVALAANEAVRGKHIALLASSTATSDLTGPACSPNVIQWTFDTWSLANSTGKSIVESGGDTWFFLTADFTFGQALQRDTAAVVTANGGKVLGAVRHPMNTADFSSFLIQAQASNAKVIGLANSGGDTINSIKQSREFGITQKGQTLAALLFFITDVHTVGLPNAEGLLLTEAFYWDLNEDTRTWSRRFAARNGGRMPTMNHAGVYSSVLAYLRAVLATGSDDGITVVNAIKASKIADPLFGTVVVRADGRAVHDMYLFQVKSETESQGPWDYYKVLKRIPGQDAFRGLDKGGCPLVKG
jgi:branched-chain amino acid transport system substrate-binding protein